MARHHRPYEGQQHELQLGLPRDGDVSSSPLRGAATSCAASPWASHASRHHRPYEGQQHVETGGHALQRQGGVIIAPTRGSNIFPGIVDAVMAALVIIAPTRGSNVNAG